MLCNLAPVKQRTVIIDFVPARTVASILPPPWPFLPLRRPVCRVVLQRDLLVGSPARMRRVVLSLRIRSCLDGAPSRVGG